MWAQRGSSLRLNEARAAERLLLHRIKPSFAFAANDRFPPLVLGDKHQ